MIDPCRMNNDDATHMNVEKRALICHCCIDYNKVILKDTNFDCARGLKNSASFRSNFIEQTIKKTDEDAIENINVDALKKKLIAAVQLAQEDALKKKLIAATQLAQREIKQLKNTI